MRRILTAVMLLLTVATLFAAAPLLAATVPQETPQASPSAPGDSGLSFLPRRPDWNELVVPVDAAAMAVVVNVSTGQSFPDLAQAVAAAQAGAVLEVRGGTLLEGQVLIDKDLTIRGATGNEILVMTVDTGDSGDARGWLVVDTGVDLTVRDLTFDGNGHLVYQGFRHKGSGSFVNCHFRDIQYNATGPDYQGTAIVAFGGNVDVLDSTFEQIGRVGVLAFGSGLTASLIVGNTYTGKGDGAFFDYAFEVNAGAQVLIVDNTVTGNRGVVPAVESAAVLATTANGAGTTAIIEENTFLDNGNAIIVGFDPMIVDGTLAALSHNRLVGNLDGLVSFSSTAVLAENNWWGCNGGPGAVGCDPLGSGSTGTIDADPWLVLRSWLPSVLAVSRDTPFKSKMIYNSDGADTSAAGQLPDGIPITFDSGTLGTVLPSENLILDAGIVSSVFAAGDVTGDSQLSATVDNETIIVPYRVAVPIFIDGFETGNTLAWSSTVP